MDLRYSPIHTVLEKNVPPFWQRVIQFDPTEVYSRVEIKPFNRRQNLDMPTMFPNLDPGFCACGCKKKLTGRQTRWSENCDRFPAVIFRILQGDSSYIRDAITWFHPFCCCKCGCGDSLNANYASNLQVDHVIAIINGGGGCWLGNFQILCHKCHAIKTGIDKITRNRVPTMQPSLLFT